MSRRSNLAFIVELGWIAAGRSEVGVGAKNKRFGDPAWQESHNRALAQSYIAWGQAPNRFVDAIEMDRRDAERVRRANAARRRRNQ